MRQPKIHFVREGTIAQFRLAQPNCLSFGRMNILRQHCQGTHDITDKRQRLDYGKSGSVVVGILEGNAEAESVVVPALALSGRMMVAIVVVPGRLRDLRSMTFVMVRKQGFHRTESDGREEGKKHACRNSSKEFPPPDFSRMPHSNRRNDTSIARVCQAARKSCTLAAFISAW